MTASVTHDSRNRTFVVVGASLAGATAAETLRARGFDGRIVLVGEEAERPYERPSLSKSYLRGEDADATYVHEAGFYEREAIELRTGTVANRVRLGDHVVELAGGEQLRYDRLLLATGARPRTLDVPGADLDGVHTLRTKQDADRVRDDLGHAGDVVVLGAGFIASEVAASARQVGRRVAMVARGAVPLQRVLGPELGTVYRDLHAAHGVELHLRAGVTALLGDGHVEAVALADGSSVPADVVVIGAGARPRDELAVAAGLVVDDGITVDAHLRTSDPDVFAAGDVAAAFHPTFDARVRVEHWANARNQGPVAALNMLGIPTVYDRIPYLYSDQYELGMEYWGHAARWDRVVVRGRPHDGKFMAFWLAGERLVAGMAANVWDQGDAITRLIRDRVVVDTRALADADTPLEALGG